MSLFFCISIAPVTGVYSDWSHWSSCSATCGGGTQERTRKCSFPKDTQGGVDCSSLGPSLETRECNALLCPGMSINKLIVKNKQIIEQKNQTKECQLSCSLFLFLLEFSSIYFISFAEDGGYSVWSDWSDCDVTCGGGLTQRYRTCNSPSPTNGGRDCAAVGLGPAMESKACNLISCPRKWEDMNPFFNLSMRKLFLDWIFVSSFNQMMAATLIGPAGHSATKPVERVPGTGHDPAPIPLLLTVDTTARGSGATERCHHVMMVRVKVRKVSLLKVMLKIQSWNNCFRLWGRLR